MTETLLSPSAVFLFGRKVEDLKLNGATVWEVTVVARSNQPTRRGHKTIHGHLLSENEKVLLTGNAVAENGIWTVGDDNDDWVRVQDQQQPAIGAIVVALEEKLKFRRWIRKDTITTAFEFEPTGHKGRRSRGHNRLLEQQLEDACFARIYGFTFEGTYYDLPRPALFLVHGDGDLVTKVSGPDPLDSRAPRGPSIAGLGAADFDFADDIKVWSYDKADYTIRMDVDTGMFEQVLLDAFFNGGGGGGVSGAMVSGAMVGGPSARGAMVRGAMVSGAMLRGRRGGRGDPSD